MDDGAVDPDDSLDMARILTGFGFKKVHCTPHLIRGGFENPPERVVAALNFLQRLVDDAGVDLKLVPGTEHYFDEYLSEMIPGALLVGSTRYLLVEIPFKSGADLLPTLMAVLGKHRLSPLFAHPERCAAFHPAFKEDGLLGALSSLVLGKQKEFDMRHSLVMELKQSGCRFQGNIGSFAGVYGRVVQQRAVLFLKHGIYSCLGSDAHTCQGLTEILSGGYDVIVATVGEDEALRLLRGGEFEQD